MTLTEQRVARRLQGGDLNVADEAAGYIVTANRAAGALDAGDSSGGVEATGFVLAPGEANVYAGFPAGVAAVKEETQFGFGDDE